MDLTLCNYCGNEVPSDEISTDIHGNSICQVCVEGVRDTSTTIKIFERSGIYEFLWSPIMGFRERASFNPVETVPGIKWFAEDGHAQTRDGFTSIVVNWIVSVVGEDAPKLKKFMGLMKLLTSRQVIPPMPVIITMAQYDGLSMGINVIVRSTDSELFKEWMSNTQQLRLH